MLLSLKGRKGIIDLSEVKRDEDFRSGFFIKVIIEEIFKELN